MGLAEPSNRKFAISPAEIKRRRAAFDRLAMSTTLAAAVFSTPAFAACFPALLLGVLLLGLFFIGARAALALSFKRFARTVWTITEAHLNRADERSSEQYPLAEIRRLRTKRNTAGGIRELRLGLEGGRSVYINGLEDFETFRDELRSRAENAEESVLREAVDFDHAMFYIVLGVLFGLLIALIARAARYGLILDMRYVYGGLAAYLLAMGAYWLRAKPVSGRFGEKNKTLDYIVGSVILCLGACAALLTLLR